MSPSLRTLVADRGDAGVRLDLVLRRHLTDVDAATRTRVQAWIEGGQVTVNVAYNNPGSTAQTLTLKVSLTTPATKTLMLTVPLTLKANQSGNVSWPLPIAKSTPVGLYSVTLDVFVGATQVGTSSAQLTVTK